MATRNTVKALGEAFKLQDVRVESFIYITYTQTFLSLKAMKRMIIESISFELFHFPFFQKID